jgi:hypothetical protein
MLYCFASLSVGTTARVAPGGPSGAVDAGGGAAALGAGEAEADAEAKADAEVEAEACAAPADAGTAGATLVCAVGVVGRLHAERAASARRVESVRTKRA